MAELAEKQWVIVTTASQHENKVANDLRLRRESLGLQNYIFDIIVAEHEVDVPVTKNGEPTGETKKKIKNIYPGYIFVEAIMTDEAWYVIRNTDGVTGIVGSSGGGQKPAPIPLEQIEPVLKRIGRVDVSMYDRYNVGDAVKVIKGPLEGTEGTILSIDKETGACRVETIFFGRSTPVDVEFSEIEKI